MHLPGVIELGYTGENAFRTIQIDMRPWLQVLPDGVASIVLIRPGETAEDAYIAATTMEDGILTWLPGAGDLGEVEGYGQMEVWLEDTNEKRGKSAKCQTFVQGSLSPTSETPPPAQESWLEQMTGLKTETVSAAREAQTAQAGAEDAQAAAEDALNYAPRISGANHWIIWDASIGDWVDTGVTAVGQPGAQGPTGIQGPQGPQGNPGRDGINGAVLQVQSGEFGFEVDSNGHLILVYASGIGEVPDFRIDSNGHLIYTFD